jgi:hypothetical protein
MSKSSNVVKFTTITTLSELNWLASKLSEEYREVEAGLRVRWNASRREQGLILRGYQRLYRPNRQWTKFLKVVGIAEKTAYRLIEDAARIEEIPAVLITAAESRGVDLAKGKYAPTVTLIEAELGKDDLVEVDEDSAEKILAKVISFKTKSETHGLFAKLSTEEKSEWNVGMKLRTALNNISDNKKLGVIIAALEQEMYSRRSCNLAHE